MTKYTIVETKREQLREGTVIEIDGMLRVVTRIEGENVYLLALDGSERRYDLSQVLEETK